MRHFHTVVAVFSSLLILTACGGGNSAKNKTKIKVEYAPEEEDLYNFEAFNLKPYGIEAMVYLPDESASIGASTDPEILHEMDGYEWDLMAGPSFHMKIEDWGDDSFQAFISAVEDQMIYTIDFIEREDNFIFYKTTLKSDGEETEEKIGEEHISYHVAAQHTINGINYVFRSSDEGCDEDIAKYMAKSVRSVKELEVKI